MGGPVWAWPRVLYPVEAWQVEAGNDQLQAAGKWVADVAPDTGLYGEDAPYQCVWVDAVRPARVGDWIVKTAGRVQILSPEQFADGYELLP